jgi:hypothetical protein
MAADGKPASAAAVPGGWPVYSDAPGARAGLRLGRDGKWAAVAGMTDAKCDFWDSVFGGKGVQQRLSLHAAAHEGGTEEGA